MQCRKLRTHAVEADTSLPQNVLQAPHSLNYVVTKQFAKTAILFLQCTIWPLKCVTSMGTTYIIMSDSQSSFPEGELTLRGNTGWTTVADKIRKYIHFGRHGTWFTVSEHLKRYIVH